MKSSTAARSNGLNASDVSVTNTDNELPNPDIPATSAWGLAILGLALFAAYNDWRFGSPLSPGRYVSPNLFQGNPLAGFLSLALSPGKGVFFFCPPLLLVLMGAGGLLAHAPVLAAAVIMTTLVHAILIVQLPFFGGDWCW